MVITVTCCLWRVRLDESQSFICKIYYNNHALVLDKMCDFCTSWKSKMSNIVEHSITVDAMRKLKAFFLDTTNLTELKTVPK